MRTDTHTQNTMNVSKCITLSRWTRNIWDHDAFLLTKSVVQRMMQHHTYNRNVIECDTKSKAKKKMPVFYLVCSFNGCTCEMCYWNAPFECRFKWNHSNRFSSSTVINGNQHWHFHGCFHYFKKIFYTKFFILTFCLVVLSHLIQQFSSLLMLQHGIFRNPIIKVLFS